MQNETLLIRTLVELHSDEGPCLDCYRSLFRANVGELEQADVFAAQALADVATIAILQHRVGLNADVARDISEGALAVDSLRWTHPDAGSWTGPRRRVASGKRASGAAVPQERVRGADAT